MKLRLLTTFVLGMLIGGVAVFTTEIFQHRDPMLACSGRVQLDTTSPEDLRLNGAVFIENSGAYNGRVYLRFTSDAARNHAIGKNATLTGVLRAVRIDDGNYISELLVGKIEDDAENREPDTTENTEDATHEKLGRRHP